MAKTTILANAVVITSALTIAQIELVLKYRRDAAFLYEASEDGGKGVPVFGIGLTNGEGSINQNGVVFSRNAEKSEGKATLTILRSFNGNPKDEVVDAYGSALAKLNKLETAILPVIAEIESENAAIAASITVA